MKKPISVEEALAIVLESTRRLPEEEIPFEETLGRVLREEVRADHDYPGFDKSMMDGYAVMAADLKEVPRTLEVVQEIPAGTDPSSLRTVRPGTAAQIMTGAPVPPGADAVLIVEETTPGPTGGGTVIANGTVGVGENIARRGEDAMRGDLLLAPGEFLGPGEIGVLASCGRTRVRVGARPRVAVLVTGDEVIDPNETPTPGRIRDCNGPLLGALLRRAGVEAELLGIVRDETAALVSAIETGLGFDVLMLSGGVSMGVYDLVGEVLRSVGVEVLFDRVAIKPGRPFTFGRRGGTLVFGCPGNPVSTYVIFQVFALPALRRMMGSEGGPRDRVRGVLESAVSRQPGRDGYRQARARWTGGGYSAHVLPTSGSADFVSCARGNALAIIPADRAAMDPGEEIDLILLDDFAER